MTKKVAPQEDVGSLSLQGLARFSQMLSTLSADNVSPMAMIQMEKLGALFPVNGEYAAKVPDLLQRYSSVQIDRLSLAIGWRKGDAASLMATSADGQAVSLLCVCLCSLLRPDDIGEVLSQLHQKFLPRNAISSVSQLANVAILLGSKLDTLGFGNLLAHQAMKVNSTYKQLSIPFPNDFLEHITSESLIELFYSLSRALREEIVLVRISGSCGMGHVLGVVLMLFPQDVVVTVENIVIHEGLRRSILLEIVSREEYNGLMKIQVEITLDTATSGPLLRNLVKSGDRPLSRYCFAWSGWIAHYLELKFLAVGLVCTQDLLLACCELLVLIPDGVKPQNTEDSDLPKRGLIALLGPAPYQRMRQICLSTFQVQPRMAFTDLSAAYWDLVSVFSMVASRVQCSCDHEHIFDPSKAWNDMNERPFAISYCRYHDIWAAIGNALNRGLSCFFVEAGPNATFREPEGYRYIESFAADAISKAICPGGASINRWTVNCNTLHNSITSLCYGPFRRYLPHPLAFSSDSSTIFPLSLEKLHIDSAMRVSYILLEGQIFFKDRYYHQIVSARVQSPRKMAWKSLTSPKNKVFPSSVGEHSHILLTLNERCRSLEICTSVRVSGVNLDLNMGAILMSSYGLNVPEPCSHPPSDPLVPELQELVRTTSIYSPYAPGWISVVQTHHNPTAQFLACENVPTLWLKDCCLNCAVRQAKNESFEIIIVS